MMTCLSPDPPLSLCLELGFARLPGRRTPVVGLQRSLNGVSHSVAYRSVDRKNPVALPNVDTELQT